MRMLTIFLFLCSASVSWAGRENWIFSVADSAPSGEKEKRVDPYELIVTKLLDVRQTATKKVVVVRFSYSDGRDSLDGDVLAERITNELIRQKYSVIERSEKRKLLEELKFQHSGLADAASVKKIGAMAGADWIVLGTIIDLANNQLELNVRMVDVESGDVVSAATGSFEKDWLDRYEELLKSQEEKTKDSVEAKLFYEKGRTYFDLGKYSDAYANFSLAITLDPKYADAYKMRGRANIESHDRDVVESRIADYTKAIEINPKDAEAYQLRGGVYAMLSMWDRDSGNRNALLDFSTAIALSPKDTSIYRQRAFLYKDINEPEEAIEDFSTMISLDSRSAIGYVGRGVLLAEKKEYGRALKDFNAAIAISSSAYPASWVFFERGKAHSAMGDVSSGIRDFSKALNAPPFEIKDKGEIYFERGKLYKQRGELQKAMSDYEAALGNTDKTTISLMERAMQHESDGEFKKATADYQSAVIFTPRLPEILKETGFLLEKMGEKQRALFGFKLAARLDPKLISELEPVVSKLTRELSARD